MTEEENEVEFIEPDEGFNFGKGEHFSHPQLVMSAMNDCRIARTREMKKGYTTIKKDKFGNEIRFDIEDTRLKFIESVEALRMVMGSDIDKEAEDNLKLINNKLTIARNTYLLNQQDEWKSYPPHVQKGLALQGKGVYPGKLSDKYFYYEEFLMDKVIFQTEVYVVLDKLAKGLGYYKEGMREA